MVFHVFVNVHADFPRSTLICQYVRGLFEVDADCSRSMRICRGRRGFLEVDADWFKENSHFDINS
eukprot:5579197-Heterocapsa_arctica.AAC.1